MASTGPVEKYRVKKKPLKKWNLQDTVTIRAGDAATGRDLVTHRELACYYSPVFKAAFNSQFIEGETQKYTLADVSPAVGRLLIHWFYHQELDLEFNQATKSRADMHLCELWVLADKLMIPSLQNTAVLHMEWLRLTFHTISTNCLNYVYENTEWESPLRMLFLHWCAFNMAESRFMEKPEHFPKEMLLELAALQSRALPQRSGELRRERRDMMMFKVEELE